MNLSTHPLTHWLIIRTETRKETYVARQIERLGYEVWLPAQIIVTRPNVSRRDLSKGALQKVKELPILPRRLFARMDGLIGGEVTAIRHYDGCERDAELRFVRIPHSQIVTFRAEIDRENTASLALAQKASRKQKARWKSLHDALVEMIQGAKEQLEQAA